MVEFASMVKRTSRNCEKALDMDYIEMLIHKKKLEGEVVKALDIMSNVQTKYNSDMFIQFPHHESLLVSIKTCPYIVRGTYVDDLCYDLLAVFCVLK